MRIATSTVYDQQTASIDNLEAQYQSQASQLSTGKSFNGPGDNPTIVGQDLAVRTTLANEQQQTTNIQNATAQLTTTDSALANLTSLVQSARTLAVQGSSDTLSPQGRQALGTQVDQLLQQAVAVANTNYGGTYIFAGSAQPTTAPVTAQGNPISGVTFAGNESSQGQLLYNGQNFALSTTLQQAFNYNAADGSPDVFSVLATLRDTMNTGDATDQSATSLNKANQVIQGAGSTTPSTLGNAPLATPLTADNSVPVPPSTGQYSFQINSTDSAGVQHVVTYTFQSTDIIDGTITPPATQSVVGAINANTAATGISASFDVKSQRLTLTGANGSSFYVTDTPSPGATTSSNFVEAFGLQGQADYASSLSTQLNNIDNVLNVTLNARAVVGSRIDTLSSLGNQVSQDSTDNTQVQSQLEDVNVASATSQFTATQTALQAAFQTTTRLEGKTLFDYLA
ncbi:MAG: hypothetical protein WCE44_04175 [Candidatus Velthaea sp.]|jgi:flagellin-like hook-associated protein FlgL